MRLVLAFLISAFLLIGCSGQIVDPTRDAAALPPTGNTAQVRFSIVSAGHGENGRVSPAYVSVNTASATVAVTRPGSYTIVTTIACKVSTGTCSGSGIAPIGTDTFDVRLWSGTHGTGDILSRVTVVEDVPATSVQLTFTPNPVVGSVALSLSPQTLASNTVGQRTQLTLKAFDPSGALITGGHGEIFVNASGDAIKLTPTASENNFSFSPASFSAPTTAGELESTVTLTSTLRSVEFPVLRVAALDESSGTHVELNGGIQVGVPIEDVSASAYLSFDLRGLTVAYDPSSGADEVYTSTCVIAPHNSRSCEIIDLSNGQVEELEAPAGGHAPDPSGVDENASALATGGDGNIWFFDVENEAVGYVSPVLAKRAIPAYPEPFLTFGTQIGSANENCCQAGPDGNIWFLNQSGDNDGLIKVSENGATIEPISGNTVNISVETVGPPSTAWIGSGSPTAELTRVATMPLAGGPLSTVARYSPPLGGQHAEILDAAVSANQSLFMVIDPCASPGCFQDPVDVYSVTPKGTTTEECTGVQSTPTSPLVPLGDGSLVYGGYYGNFNGGVPGTFTRIVPGAGCITEEAYPHANLGIALITAAPGGAVYLITSGASGSATPPPKIPDITSIGV